MHATHVQLIRIAEDRVVFKCGVHEVLFEGPRAADVAERVLMLAADEKLSPQEVITAFPGPERAAVDNLLRDLVRRRLLCPEAEGSSSASGSSEQEAFYWNFGPPAAEAPARLAAAKVLVIGVNRIASALVQGLLDLGLGTITLVDHVILNNHLTPVAQHISDDRLQLASEVPREQDWAGYSLVCATSEFGEADALLDLNRIALAARRPYLPVWLCDLVGFVGPLNVPFETPCFGCFRLRRDANDSRYEVSRAVRGQFALGAAKTSGPGLPAPIARILGDVASLEIAKYLGGFVPADTLSRLIELNLISFHGGVRRLLKVPRCPECSDLLFRNPKAITAGPHIPPEAPSESRK